MGRRRWGGVSGAAAVSRAGGAWHGAVTGASCGRATVNAVRERGASFCELARSARVRLGQPCRVRCRVGPGLRRCPERAALGMEQLPPGSGGRSFLLARPRAHAAGAPCFTAERCAPAPRFDFPQSAFGWRIRPSPPFGRGAGEREPSRPGPPCPKAGRHCRRGERLCRLCQAERSEMELADTKPQPNQHVDGWTRHFAAGFPSHRSALCNDLKNYGVDEILPGGNPAPHRRRLCPSSPRVPG